ncbi:DUF4062 domain-containing protein [Shewanella baltica]|uniref:DUF4062 domain-containing protein n=1 Tax=Shewanella baltica TaxID=62322 RepID=UPI00217D9D5B|nr:DUF4062 domain-containing protein [Shewanella baltica]MCS6175859.1 DUF4062 domain-containing protein [Shewanella baltica]
MDKRYQVFVSSTFVDLENERQHVIQTLMEMDCIPAGMELFPAADEGQWEFIKKVIDDCDYYLLIIGGRYGSVASDGISYTEKEFDYAVEKGIKVIALIHGSPEEIASGKSERDPILQNKLIRFREKVQGKRLVKYWNTPTELPGLVALSLTSTIKAYPAIGWVRANTIANEVVLAEINELRKANASLEEALSEAESYLKPAITDIADLDSTFLINGSYKINESGFSPRNYTFSYTLSWRDLFELIAPYLITFPSEIVVKQKIASSLLVLSTGRMAVNQLTIDDQKFQTISIQLKAYGLVSVSFLKTTKGDKALFWSLTPKGEKLMIESRIVKKDDATESLA